MVEYDVPIDESNSSSLAIKELLRPIIGQSQNFDDFIIWIDNERNIPLSNLDKDTVNYLINSIHDHFSLFVQHSELNDKEYLALEMLELSLIAKVNRGKDGFERELLQKQISENLNSDVKKPKNWLKKLLGGNSE